MLLAVVTHLATISVRFSTLAASPVSVLQLHTFWWVTICCYGWKSWLEIIVIHTDLLKYTPILSCIDLYALPRSVSHSVLHFTNEQSVQPNQDTCCNFQDVVSFLIGSKVIELRIISV